MTTSGNEIEARLEVCRVAFDLSGKTALVLGAASGIGKASARRWRRSGSDNASAGRRRSVPLADIPPFT